MTTHSASRSPYASSPTVEVPSAVLDSLLASAAVHAAHYKLCPPHPHSSALVFHPGDPFGKVVAWLWASGQPDRAAILVADYLAQMRVHNPNHPDDGHRLTWARLRAGLPLAIHPEQLDHDQVEEMLAFLDEKVPSYYGSGVDIP